jgi:hypothetical protein
VPAAPALAALFHTISESQAYRVADHLGQAAANRADWAEAWGDECERQTPWTYSCYIELWTNTKSSPDCWREFDVASSALTGRLRTEEWTAWECDPWPVSAP